MESIKEIFKIGKGPSSSHTMGPKKAAEMFKGLFPGASSFAVTLYGSLAATGRGHMTDVALIEALKEGSNPEVDIIWKPEEFLPQHPNGMNFKAYDADGHLLGEKTLFSIGGGDISEDGKRQPEKDIYELCLIKLGVDGSEAVVFEDSVSGITSGKRAGCRVVALMTTIDGESAAKAGADAVISDLSALPRFSGAEEAEGAIFALSSEEKGEVYGANIIRPGRRRLSDAFTLERVKKAAAAARENAYAPYSGFKVGAAVLSASSGRIYAGCNVENSSYGATICAERNAITTAITAEGVIGIDILAVCSDDDPPAPPCAVCLQVIAEYARPDTHIVLFSVNGQERHYAFSELLPNPFVFPTMRR